MQLSNLKLIAILAAGVVATIAVGASAAHVARDFGPGLFTALSADEGVPQNLVTA